MRVNYIFNIWNNIYALLANYHMCLISAFISFVLKVSFLSYLMYHYRKKTVPISLIYITTSLLIFCSLITDSAWIIKIISLLFTDLFPYSFVISYIRFAWIGFIMQYLCIAFLIELLINNKLPSYWKQLCIPSGLLSLIIMIIGCVNYNCTSIIDRWPEESFLQSLIILYFTFFLIPFVLYKNIKKLKIIPYIIRWQFKTFMLYYVFPQLLYDFIQINPLSNVAINSITESYPFTILSTLWLNLMIYFCAHHIIKLRFLNFKKNVESLKIDRNFQEQFQHALITLGTINTLEEIGDHIKKIFAQLFKINPISIITHMHIPNLAVSKKELPESCSSLQHFYKALTHQDSAFITQYLIEHKIIIRHEVAFNTFYTPEEKACMLLPFLDSLSTDLIIPIIYKEALLGYVSINDNKEKIYTILNESQKRAAIIITSYIGTFAQMLQNNSLMVMQSQAHSTKTKFFEQEHQLALYQEGVSALLKETKQHAFGVFIYTPKGLKAVKKNSFEEYLNNNNFQVSCIKIIQKAKASEQKIYESFIMCSNNQIAASVIIDKNSILLILQHITLTHKIHASYENTIEWINTPISFYMHTTTIGNSIEEFLPTSTASMNSFKIKLLQAAITKKPLLLFAHKNDIKPLSLLLHTITKRKHYEYINIVDEKAETLSAQIFGTQKLYNEEVSFYNLGLLERCDQGTLVIENINALSFSMQGSLLQFLTSGFYLPHKGFQTCASNANLIIACAYETLGLKHQSPLIIDLENLLSHNTLYCPRFELIPEQEQTKILEDLLAKQQKYNTLHEKAQNLIIEQIKAQNPQSITEIKNLVHTMMKKNHTIEDHYKASLPIEAIIAKGKDALQDAVFMEILWNTFDKNQSHIASLLKVHRSSVNRRVKEYNL